MESLVLAHELTRGLTPAYIASAEDEVLGPGEVRSVAGHEVADEYPGLCAVFHVTSVDVQTADRLVTSQRPDVISTRVGQRGRRSTQVEVVWRAAAATRVPDLPSDCRPDRKVASRPAPRTEPSGTNVVPASFCQTPPVPSSHVRISHLCDVGGS